MRDIVLIGGKSNLNDDCTIEDYIVNLIDKEYKTILFFPTASNDSKKAIDNFYTQFSKYNIKIDVIKLTLDNNFTDIKNKVEKADILYFGGGNTKTLVEYLKNTNCDKLIIDAYLNNKVLVGISAGANMLSKFGMGDSYSYLDNFRYYNFKMIEGLGLLDITVCPHYQKEDLTYYNDIVTNYPFDGYALEDDTAIHFSSNDIKVIKSIKSRSIYKFIRKEKYIMKPLYEKENKIAVLGPAGTFSEVACKKYLKNIKKDYEMEFYPTVLKTALAANELGLAILPFENTLDGYILETIDILMKNDFDIACDLKTHVEFAFVSNAKNIEDVKEVYVQFKSKGQCVNFLSSKDFKLVITESNIESLESLKACNDTCGAIIPMHKLKDVKFNTVIKNVEDKEGNYTRFVVITKKKENKILRDQIKCSMCVFMNEERPGLLFELLKIFNDNNLNMVSILSRPTKEELGKYNFYMEVTFPHDKKEVITKVIDDISKSEIYRVKNLGIYSSIE